MNGSRGLLCAFRFALVILACFPLVSFATYLQNSGIVHVFPMYDPCKDNGTCANTCTTIANNSPNINGASCSTPAISNLTISGGTWWCSYECYVDGDPCEDQTNGAQKTTIGSQNNFVCTNKCPEGQNWDNAQQKCIFPPCDTGYYRDALTGQCLPQNCQPWELFNSVTNVCYTPECPTGQIRDPLSHECVAPSCGDDSVFDPVTKMCEPIQCPDGQQYVQGACRSGCGTITDSEGNTSTHCDGGDTGGVTGGDTGGGTGGDTGGGTGGDTGGDTGGGTGGGSSGDTGGGTGGDTGGGTGGGSGGGTGGGSGGSAGGGTPGETPDDSQGSASSSGDCSSPPTCTGDPVQCATLLQIWKNRCSPTVSNFGNCSDFKCESDPVQCAMLKLSHSAICAIPSSDKIKSDLESLGLKTADQINPDHDLETSEDASSLASFEKFDSASACPFRDYSFSFYSSSIVIPVGLICDYGNSIRSLILGIFYFLSALLVYRAFTK